MHRRWLLLTLALAASAVCAGPRAPARPSARAVIAQCVQRVGAEEVRGLYRLDAYCPGIVEAVQDLQLDAHLPSDWERHVSTRVLSDWSALADRYDAAAPGSRGPLEPGRLRDIARALPVPQPVVPPPNPWAEIWASVWNWIRKHRNWFPGWPVHLSGRQPQLEAMIYSVLVLVVVAAAVLIFMEMRAAGMLGRPAGRRLLRRPRSAGARHEASGTLDIAAVPPHLRPVLLLRTLVAALTRSHRLEHERVLTCRELVTSARFDTDGQRERFAALTSLAERGLYGEPGQSPPPQQEAVLADAQALEGQLLAKPAGQGAPG